MLFCALTLTNLPHAYAQKREPVDKKSEPQKGATKGAHEGADKSAEARELAYRANNRGVALLEQFRHKDGAEEFQKALGLDPNLKLARINLAIALYNIPDHDAAQKEAESALRLAPESPQPSYILGLIARTQNRVEEATAHFRRVLEIDARDVGANVNLGQLYAQQRKYEEAIELFRVALEEEPYNGTALYNLGTSLLRAGKRAEGQKAIESFQALRQSGAATTVGQNYLEQGRYAEAQASTGAESDLVDRNAPDVIFRDATAEAFPRTPFVWPSTNVLLEQTDGAVLLFDYDSDGDLDLLEAASARQRLLRNDKGKFTDVTAQTGALAHDAEGVATGAIAGDFDNDEKPDLFIMRNGASALYRNEGGGRFSDATEAAKIPMYAHRPRSAAFVDYDHDGDLDIFIAGGDDPSALLKAVEENEGDARRRERKKRKKQTDAEKEQPSSNDFRPLAKPLPPAPTMLLRNNGDGTFTERTEEAKLSGNVPAQAVVATDYDNRRDVDLLVASQEGVALWRNLRDGTFRNVTSEVGLGDFNGSATSLAAGDVNKDGFTDFYFGKGASSAALALSDGRGRFQIKTGPGRSLTENRTQSAPHLLQIEFDNASQFIDYDNDGLLDLVKAVTKLHPTGKARMELRVYRNTGDGWADVSAHAAPNVNAEITHMAGPLPGGRVLASGDVDGDGDTDVVFGVPGGGLRLARNDGGERNGAVRVRLAGKVSNRSAVGAKIEMRAGSLSQKLETYSASPAPAPADVNFGLGRRASADAVRVLWPAGIVQAELEVPATVAGASGASLVVTELDRKPSSCPYLYVWNGERFEFLTDFLGGGELGYWVAPGVRAAPDADEYVRIAADKLRAKDGRFELRITNELEETLFLDRLQLVVVEHDEGVEVHPNEGLGAPTSETFRLYNARNARTPRAATDDDGRDALARISRMDREYPDAFRLHKIRGYAEEHALTLDLGRGDDLILLLTGWTDYAFSSDNVAASQMGMSLKAPALQVRDERGEWRTVIENIGVPVGRPQTVAVDLKGKFLSESREARIVTNMRIYWDQILVSEKADASANALTRLDPKTAALRWRGYSAESTPDGREPYGYDYARVMSASPWKVMPGRYTREGDVLELLSDADDMFVVARTGDEIAVSFDASSLPPLPRGRARTFLLYSAGFSKEMDINSASPDQVAPLPFKGMKDYPYSAPESYPATPAHLEYLERYNTRVVKRGK